MTGIRVVAGFIVLLLACSPSVLGIECGTTGNNYWQQAVGSPSTGPRSISLDDEHIYWSHGTTVATYTKNGLLLSSHDFVGSTPRRPVPLRRWSNDTVLIVAASDGFVYSLDLLVPIPSLWSRSTRRASCATDTIAATPVVQRRADSNAAFQAAFGDDLVLVGTDAQCSTSTANKVFGLHGDTGNVAWTFNSLGSLLVDSVQGLAVDHGRNHVYVVTKKIDPLRVQSTVWALNTLNGAKIWSVDFGPIRAEPLLTNAGLFVVSLAGVLHKVNPENGQTLWSLPLFPEGSAEVELDLTFLETLGYVFVTDSDGTFRVVRDDGTSGTVLLSTDLQGHLARSPAVLDPSGQRAYVGDEGRAVWQMGVCTLSPGRYLGDLPSPAGVVRELLLDQEGPVSRMYTMASNGTSSTLTQWCVPWPVPPPNPDADSDGAPDCLDGCPTDEDKTAPGLCGCGIPDTDSDGDTVPDCNDACPLEPPLVPIGATLSLAKQAGGVAALAWTPASPTPAWNLYSGSLARPWTYNETCLQTWIEQPQATDARILPPGQGYFYLVTAVNACEETAATLATSGPHVPPAPCQLICLPGDPCSDSNVCTADDCEPGAGCQHVPVAGSCEDGNACTSDDACVSGVCTGGLPTDCDDENLCTDDSCDAPSGCQHLPTTACDDGDACTDDSCDAQSGCGHSPTSCDDGIACTADSCLSPGGCVHMPDAGPCDDNDPCTADTCDVIAGCLHTPSSGAPCNDGSVCTTADTCDSGACSGTPLSCDDGIACTVDGCNLATGCTHTANNAACNDGLPCTADACNPASGCVTFPLPVGTACNDGDLCGYPDACNGSGVCVSGGPADHLVISQFQLAGNNETDEFVELYNPTTSPISLTGMFLHYRAFGGTHTVFTLPGATIQPHRFYLVGSSGYSGSISADVTQNVFSAPLPPTSPGGTLYLVQGTASFSGPSCPSSAQIIDRVGWGTGSGSCPEGGMPTQVPGLNSSVIRKPHGTCGNGRDTNNNGADFLPASIEQPRNSSSPQVP